MLQILSTLIVMIVLVAALGQCSSGVSVPITEDAYNLRCNADHTQC